MVWFSHFRLSAQQRVPLRWYPPEYFKSNYYSFKGDVWAFGIVLWEMQTFGELVAQVRRDGQCAFLLSINTVFTLKQFHILCHSKTTSLVCGKREALGYITFCIIWLFQAHCRIQTWRRQRQWRTTSALVIKTQTLKAADQRCKWKLKKSSVTFRRLHETSSRVTSRVH